MSASDQIKFFPTSLCFLLPDSQPPNSIFNIPLLFFSIPRRSSLLLLQSFQMQALTFTFAPIDTPASAKDLFSLSSGFHFSVSMNLSYPELARFSRMEL
jgi:hypothetical protein